MLFHIFRHVQADDRLFLVEELLSEGFGEFRFADAGGSDEKKDADGAVGDR